MTRIRDNAFQAMQLRMLELDCKVMIGSSQCSSTTSLMSVQPILTVVGNSYGAWVPQQMVLIIISTFLPTVHVKLVFGIPSLGVIEYEVQVIR